MNDAGKKLWMKIKTAMRHSFDTWKKSMSFEYATLPFGNEIKKEKKIPTISC